MADPAIFTGRMQGGRVVLDFPAQHDSYVARFEDGARMEVVVRREKLQRTDRQNRALWALLNAWANARGHNVNDLKDDLMGEVFGWNDTPSPISHRILPRRTRTSKLSVVEFCLVIDELLRLAAETDGLVLMAPDEYRRAKEAAQHLAEHAARKGVA